MVVVQCPRSGEGYDDVQPRTFERVLFEKFDQFGSRTAIIDANNGAIVTFDQLRRLSYKTAAAFTQKYRKRNAVIGSFMENSPELLISVVGIMISGNTYTGMHPMATPEEVIGQFGACAVEMLLTHSRHHRKVLDALRGLPTVETLLLLDGDVNVSFETEINRHFPNISVDYVKDQWTGHGTANANTPDDITQEDIAFMPHSSGTTGLPKGILLSHRATCEWLRTIVGISYRPSAHDVAISAMPVFHTGGFLFIFAPLRLGSTLVLMSKFDGATYADLIVRYKVTLLNAAPTMLLSLVKNTSPGDQRLDSVRGILFGSSPAGQELLRLLRERMKNLMGLCQTYGMSEAGGVVGMPVMDLDKVPLQAAGVPGLDVKIKFMSLDTEPKELDPYEPGELWIHAPRSRMTRYHNNPKETALTVRQDGWIRSGDIGYTDYSGYIYITDRIKELIKYKGYQVAPAEIEDVILKHPAVVEVGVTGLPSADVNIGELATAFVVVKKEPSPELADQIVQHVTQHLSGYKHLRGGVKFRSFLPKTASGKVMRRQLKKDSIAKAKL